MKLINKFLLEILKRIKTQQFSIPFISSFSSSIQTLTPIPSIQVSLLFIYFYHNLMLYFEIVNQGCADTNLLGIISF